MGVVYLGRDPRIDRRVAIKVVRTEAIESRKRRREFLDRFFREAQAAGRLSHANIVTIYDADEDPDTGRSYIAMEYVEGVTLSAWLEERDHMSVNRAYRLMKQLLDALDYAHDHGTVHRDIKPANILLTDGGGLKVTDFGIARISSSDMTQSGQILGTPGYMSPEQVQGKHVDGRSDLFSAAVVLYRILTGRKPFVGDDFATTCYQILHAEPTPPSQLQSDLPPELDAVLRKALAKEADERYQSGAEFAADLKEAVEGREPKAITAVLSGGSVLTSTGETTLGTDLPTEPATGARWAPAWARLGSNRALLAAGAAVAILILALAGWTLFPRGDRSPEAVVPADAAPPPASTVGAAHRPEPVQEVEEGDPAAVSTPLGDSGRPDPPEEGRAISPESSREAPAPDTPRPPAPAPEKTRAEEAAPVEAARALPAVPASSRPAPQVLVPVRVEIYHRMAKGEVTLSVDGREAKSQEFEGRFKIRKNQVMLYLDVPEGKRSIQVRVVPGGSEERALTAETERTIREGGGYVLKVKVGSREKSLELAWD
jgi:serine/threonine-protein kinase